MEIRYCALIIDSFSKPTPRELKAMKFLMRKLFLPTLCLLFLAAGCVANEQPEPASHPPITGGVPFFYYQDIAEAKDWYENKLGLEVVTDEGWVVIIRLTPSSYLGLVNATGGTLRPIDDKGALLSIETNHLEEWWEELKDVEGINMIHGIEIGAQGLIQEFRMVDPGGYQIEFFRWQPEYSPH